MINNLLNEAKASLELYKNAGGEKPATADSMYEALTVVLHPSDYDNDTRLNCLLKLLMKSAQAVDHKEEVIQFTSSLIATDYYFSLGNTHRPVPFLNKSLKAYRQVMGTVQNSIENADYFAKEFIAGNFKGKFSREYMAVQNLYILAGAAQKLGLEMAELDELPADQVPMLWTWRTFPLILLLGVGGALMVMYAFSEYRQARLGGTPIPLLDALQPEELPLVFLGLILVIAEFALLFWEHRPSYNHFMAGFYYWKFSLRS